MLKFVILLFLLSSSSSLNLSKENKEKENTQITVSPYFHLFPYFPCSTNESIVIQNKSKQKWLIEYKVSTTFVGGDSSNSSLPFVSNIHVLILAQQMSVIRPRILQLSFNNENIKDKDKLIKLYYQNDKKPQINPILLSVQNGTLLNLDKSIDVNYENIIDNYSKSNNGKVQKYKEMKKPKINFTLVIDRYHQYIVKIYLTTNSRHFAHLKWSPSLY